MKDLGLGQRALSVPSAEAWVPPYGRGANGCRSTRDFWHGGSNDLFHSERRICHGPRDRPREADTVPEVPTHDADDDDLQRRRAQLLRQPERLDQADTVAAHTTTERVGGAGLRRDMQRGNLHGARLIGRAQGIDDHRYVRTGPEVEELKWIAHRGK